MSRIGLAAALVACLIMLGCGSPQPMGDILPEATQHGSPGTSDVLADPPAPLSYVQRQGREIYDYYCSPCHGEGGEGDGFNSYNLDPKPRSFKDQEFQRDRSDDDLVRVIRTGGGGVGLSTGMPPWGRTLTEREIDYVMGYVRALGSALEVQFPDP